MSKTRKPSPKKRMKSLSVRVKYKLGGRKSPKSALQLKNDELLALFAKPTRKRDKTKLESLVRARGLSLVPPVVTTEEPLTEA
jgi:hypothetical protein